jgi:hypothetical protein
LGTVAPAELTRARRALHWAAQVPAYAGAAFVEPAADDSHMALTWVSPEVTALASQPSSRAGRVVSLDVTTLAVTLLGPGRVAEDHLDLGNRTLAEALAWVTAAFAPDAPRTPPVPFPPYEMPEPPAGAAGALGAPDVAAALLELARWYHDADLLLQQVRATVAGASPVRCWPHHFDIATLVTVAPGKTIGVGLSPGDGSYAEPYLYLTPWPHRPDAPLPALEGGGHWHRDGWFGAVLPGTLLVKDSAPTGQAAHAQAFLASALNASHALLDI